MFRVLNFSICVFILTRCSLALDSYSISAKISNSNADADAPQNDVEEDVSDQPAGESFRDWQEWKDRYEQCDSEYNPNASPIDISSENIVQSPNLKAFIVHSRMPVDDCLTLSILYKDKDLEMEAVTINALPACLKQLTHVYGGDESKSNIRYFKQAVFFFTNTPPEEDRSLHRINGKEFQMEIMMEFADLHGKKYTQIFSLVEAKPPETTPANPIFTIFESSLKDLRNEIINEAKGNTSRAMKLEALQTACLENEQKYLQFETDAKEIRASGRIEKIETLVKNIKSITNLDLEKLTEKKQQAKRNIASMESKEDKLEELRENRAKLFEMMKDEKRPSKLEDLQKLYKQVQFVIKKLESQIKLGVTFGNEQKLENMKALLRANKVGIPGESPFPGMLYSSPDAVHKELFELKQKVFNFERSKHIYDESCKEADDFENSPYAFVKINDPFQISWLFPQTGGYYIYDGSSPIPKCEPRDMTIVFSEPLSISTEQLALFQNLPSLEALRMEGARISSSDVSFEDKLKVDKMIPILADTEASRVVKYVSKSPVFLNDDGFHKKSSVTKTAPEGSGCTRVIGPPRIIQLFYNVFCCYSITLPSRYRFSKRII